MSSYHPSNPGDSPNGAPQYQRPVYQRPQSGQGSYGGQPGYSAPNAYNQGQYNGAGRNHFNPYNAPPPRVKGRPPLWLGIVTACLAPVIGVICLIAAFVVGYQQLDREMSDAVPGVTQELEAGTLHGLYVPSDTGVQASDCQIYSPSLGTPALSPSTSGTTLSRHGVEYTEIAEFTTSESGTYRTVCVGSSDTIAIRGDGFIVIGLGLFGSFLIGGFVLVIGIVLIVINRVSASRRRSTYY